ncbi:HAMP domain-containing protein [Corynebacterium sp. zg912]|uniref:Adenylate/guanylate cyclase domain-containing protein n=1 Tax=Corynebacterium wankanglinii TaxID=2735136 RepID=A0A7H0KAI1_9CORY|nr:MULTISPECIES: adenylate/guanylate cyclase domain-containing protein [Corynebacterium]MBA1836367.1 adenylate/guanylate cyclase domain-containing protein [Corynebacterium wankanglinii]MCR5928362.1 HAMP domain-containing protein [Corynebacterium sp. zg912]QNP94297.1 adenylate/guanylate cyclase domain-containing protein [Corynebacterium wankanglinii]
MERFWRELRWLWGTSWPLYAATVLGTNVLAAIGSMLFVRYLIPMPEVRELGLGGQLGAVGVIYAAVAVVLGAVVTLYLFRPVLEWQRHPDGHDPNMVRHLVMRLPVLQTIIVVAVWGIGIAIVTAGALRVDARLAAVVLTTALLTAFVTAVLTYLQAERLVRPIAASALARRFEDSTLQPPIKWQLYLTWFTTSAVPMVGVLLLTIAQRYGYFTGTVGELTSAIVALITAGIVTGFVGTALVIMSVADPIKELQGAINRVRRGEQNTQVDIYDGSEIGVLQAGFNEMMRGLRDRQRVRDIFGQYVGAEVAQKALEEVPELGGEERKVAVLFIDVVGSTSFAVDHTPEEVVAALNDFFDVVVEVVHRNKGVINKFQGDAALAVFGAPVSLHDAASHALQAARELQRDLAGLELKAGIGVASGHVVAGHVGGADRFEYTVIGDAVNGAARLTDLAKDTPGMVLTNAATLRAANEVEQQRWTLMKSVELRGRGKMTQLARPVRSTMADRY